jgi:hypothetical protein
VGQAVKISATLSGRLSAARARRLFFMEKLLFAGKPRLAQ